MEFEITEVHHLYMTIIQKQTKPLTGKKSVHKFHSTISSKLPLRLRTSSIPTGTKASLTKATQQTSIMENCDVPIHLRDHDYWRRRRISARQAGGAGKSGACSKCPCCRKEQVLNSTPRPQHSAATANLPQKRKRSSVPRPPKPSAEHPGKMSLVQRPLSTIPPADLPVVSNVPPSPRPPSPRPSSATSQLSSTDVNHDGPLTIHNRSVEEYQKIYHEVVDDMLRYKNGRLRPYTLELGRRIKQKLWERLDRPTMTSSVNEDGLVRVDVSYGVGVYPPLYDVDTLGEPSPGQPPNKRAKTSN
ncbi:uncharacterized protein LOC122869400 isoform X2 [Siniperca chuatsi]|uniref:uncharacterized protein LOC122869400 isoform X2 n=1 Tax=Siniperca chuatsi TaxID=119488 RepID=UPI001CE13920|nr:uncharacterized protein LOC122869400 isoform X2 [Siniperca chuatsi]